MRSISQEDMAGHWQTCLAYGKALRQMGGNRRLESTENCQRKSGQEEAGPSGQGLDPAGKPCAYQLPGLWSPAQLGFRIVLPICGTSGKASGLSWLQCLFCQMYIMTAPPDRVGERMACRVHIRTSGHCWVSIIKVISVFPGTGLFQT